MSDPTIRDVLHHLRLSLDSLVKADAYIRRASLPFSNQAAYSMGLASGDMTGAIENLAGIIANAEAVAMQVDAEAADQP